MSANGIPYKQRVRKAAELKAVADELKEQQSQLELRLNAAMGEYLQAERERKRHEPLTPAMECCQIS